MVAINQIQGRYMIGHLYTRGKVIWEKFLILQHKGREYDFMPYTETYKSMKGVSIVTAETAWTCLETGQTCVLFFHKGLWMGESMPNSLINPNKLRAYGCTVQDNPFCGLPLYIEDPEGVLTVSSWRYEYFGNDKDSNTR